MITVHHYEPGVMEVAKAIREGDLPALNRLLDRNPELTRAAIRDEKGVSRTLLHIATDWPGHFPNGNVIIRSLIQRGADPNARVTGASHTETPLHWAASSDDVVAIDELLDGGADVEASGASIGGGTPLDDAVGYGQFNAARRLVERGARTRLWHAAALGMLDRLEQCFTGSSRPTAREITEAFWQACHGGERPTAEFLLNQGAELNWIPCWSSQTALDIASVSNPGRPPAPDLVTWLKTLGAKTAAELRAQ